MTPRMRTINEAAEELRTADPHTAVTAHLIRQLILTGKVPAVKAGKKYLLNLDTLQAYLENPTEPTTIVYGGGIRKISERV